MSSIYIRAGSPPGQDHSTHSVLCHSLLFPLLHLAFGSLRVIIHLLDLTSPELCFCCIVVDPVLSSLSSAACSYPVPSCYAAHTPQHNPLYLVSYSPYDLYDRLRLTLTITLLCSDDRKYHLYSLLLRGFCPSGDGVTGNEVRRYQRFRLLAYFVVLICIHRALLAHKRLSG